MSGFIATAVKAVDMDMDGDLDLAITSSDGYFMGTFENTGNGNFSFIGTFSTIGDPFSIYPLDIELDGDLDLLLSVGQVDYLAVAVMVNNGGFQFTAQSYDGLSDYTNWAYATDIDKDGYLDIVANTGDLLLNQRNGAFTLSGLFTWNDAKYIGDYDLDGSIDTLEIAGEISGEGLAGDFNNDGRTEFGTGSTGADFDGDGDLDLLSFNGSNFTILLNQSKEPDIALSTESHDFGSLAIGDVSQLAFQIYNKGGADTLHISGIVSSHPDLIVDVNIGLVRTGDSLEVTVSFAPTEAQLYGDSLTITSNDPDEPVIFIHLTGTGTPTLTATTPVAHSVSAAENTPVSVTFSGDMDAATLNDSTFRVFGNRRGLFSGVYTYDAGTRTSTFTPSMTFMPGEQVQVVLTEGVQAASNAIPLGGGYSFTFTVNALFGSGQYVAGTPIATGNTPFATAVGDLDGDGYDDLVVANSADNTLSIFINDQQSGLIESAILINGANPQGVAVADVDADGDMDILSANNSDNTVVTWLNDGNLVFISASALMTGPGPRGLSVSDLNNDGWLGVITANTTGGDVSTFFSDGAGGFGTALIHTTGLNPSGVVAASIYNDGKIDVLASNKGSNTVSVIHNIGGDFNSPLDYPTGSSPNDLVAFDIDSDGDEDVLTANGSSNNISILRNNGDGIFGTATSVAAGTQPISLVAYDADADGDLDVAVANFTSNDVHILTNDGLGNFTPTDTIAVGNGPRDIVALDMSGGFGIMDLAVVNLSDNTLQILKNQVPGGMFTNVSIAGNEQSGDIPINYNVYDPSQGIIGLLAEVSTDDGNTWSPASVLGDTSALTADAHRGSLTWQSTADLTDFDGTVMIKVTPHGPTTAGTADSASFALDNYHGQSISIALAEPGMPEYSDTVFFDYQITDTTHDQFALIAEYRLGAGAWQPAVIAGAVSGTDSSKYLGSFYWLSTTDLPTHDVEDLRFKITPSDGWEVGPADSTGNLHIDNNTPPSMTLSLAVAGEQSGLVDLETIIVDSESDSITVYADYSIDIGATWTEATIIGGTTILTPGAHTLSWDSNVDLPGKDLEDIQIRMTPADKDTGSAGILTGLHVDNNLPPTISLANLPGEQKENVSIPYALTDAEGDTLSLIAQYSVDGTTWENASVSSSVVGITSYSDSLIWTSITDLPEGIGYIDFSITPSDKDLGQSDTLTFFLDNIGAPVLTSITTPNTEVSGDISFDYEVQDDEGDSVHVAAEYSLDAGASWQEATSSNIQNDMMGYNGTVVWHSDSNTSGVDTETALLRITPQEVFTGINGLAGVTEPFHLDNNEPPSITVQLPADTLATSTSVTFEIADPEGDIISLNVQFSSNGRNWNQPTLSNDLTAISPSEYTDTTIWDLINDFGFARVSGVELTIVPFDNDPGITDIIRALTILNYPGDYTGDFAIATDDLIQFASAWNATPQNLAYEIGPATGTVPELVPQPDGVLDFEDLVVFVQMWNWSFANNGFAKSVPVLAKTASIRPSLRLIQDMPENLWDWDGRTVIRLEGDVPKNLMMIDGLITVNGARVRLNQFAGGGELAVRWQTVPLFMQVSEDSSQYLMALAGLGLRDDVESGDDWPLLTFEADLAGEGTQTIAFDYTLWDTQGEPTESGSVSLSVENLMPMTYSLHQNYPNPFNPTTTIRYELPTASKVQLRIYNLRGQEVIRLVDEDQTPGYRQAIWTGRDRTGRSVSSGIYIARLVAPGFAKSVKMVLLK